MTSHIDIERLDLYGLTYSNVDFNKTVELVTSYNFQKPGYICFPSTNIVAKVYKDPNMQQVFNSSFLTLADGKFTEYYFRLKGIKTIKNISGYWLMENLLKSSLTHYFYGGDEITIEKLRQKLGEKYPTARILGYKSPPFLTIDEIKKSETIKQDVLQINNLKPDLIWIGISNLKQDVLMNHYLPYLNQGLMLGVGAVFLYMSGQVKKGPEWIKKLGLRWLVRLIQEPRKEWKKTVPSIALFIKLFFKEIFNKLFRRNANTK
ncbi:MAG: WecB/TagA/CpsF family glycosyltransferase [Bacteroidales bacterium]|nr:WecB/TagA/CpsF family glycosyltransferase [Bacteroidales bacterium]